MKLILHGCNGAMGRVISDMCAAEPDIEIAAGVDLNTEQHYGYPVFSSMEACDDVQADVILDFSVAKAVDPVVAYAVSRKLPLVLCTTGLSEAQIASVSEASAKTAVLRSGNMSLGMNLLMKLVAEGAKVLADRGYDIEIIEQHHHRKVDAPSGSALMLADAANDACGGRFHYVYGRADRHEKRDADEIGIMSVRAGSIVGEHDVIFAGEDEVITLKHSAYSRKIFAKGALSAARFLSGKTSGLYSMADVIG